VLAALACALASCGSSVEGPGSGPVNGGAVDYNTCRTVESEAANEDATNAPVPDPNQLGACYQQFPPNVYAN
jgi:hypothetical protein